MNANKAKKAPVALLLTLAALLVPALRPPPLGAEIRTSTKYYPNPADNPEPTSSP